ncbi:TPA: hypothetical protein PNO53_000337 [Salmonella enterica]|nr:hypothetical protein [Salmonella enterica]
MKLAPYLITLSLPFLSLSAEADYHTQINAGNTVSGDVVDSSKGNQLLAIERYAGTSRHV